MKTVTVYRKDGGEAGTMGLPDEIFGIEPSMTAIYHVTKAYLANRRQGNASTKSRGEVRLVKSKLYRQKGTGRARAGSANSPLRVGGGVTFAKVCRDFGKRMPKKQRRLARDSAILAKFKSGCVVVVDELSFESPKTKDFSKDESYL